MASDRHNGNKDHGVPTLSQAPPPLPWKRGKTELATIFHLKLTVVENQAGWVFSEHEFLKPKDQKLAEGLSMDGNRQIAHSLFMEAVKREIFLCANTLQHHDKDYLKKYAASSTEEKAFAAAKLSLAARGIFTATFDKMGDGMAQTVLEMLAQGQEVK